MNFYFQTEGVSSELVLKLSYMAFENEYDNLLHEYAKTYWNICADRLLYIEKQKTKCSIRNLLTKLSEDIYKIIQMYDSIQFCSTIMNFLIKKLHFLYSGSNPSELNTVFGKLFNILSSKDDLKNFKNLSKGETLDMFTKLIDCLYVIAENGTKIDSKESSLTNIVLCIVSLIGHNSDIHYCLLNFICPISSIFEKQNTTYTEAVLNNLITNFDTAEKSGYGSTMHLMYPFISQFMKLYIEGYITYNENLNMNYSESIQESCLKIIYFLMRTLKQCKQISKCLNCDIKTGLHDALRLSFLSKQIIILSIDKNISTTTTLPVFCQIILYQYKIIKELCFKNCNNHEKGYNKVQSDIHNTAIVLNSKKQYEFAIKLFNIYLENEITNFKTEVELKNISRALYNKSISELEFQQHKEALKDAYLSLIFAQPEGLCAEKHMSLVIDTKSKALTAKNDSDELQLMTVLDVCEMTVKNNDYGNMKPFFCNLKFR